MPTAATPDAGAVVVAVSGRAGAEHVLSRAAEGYGAGRQLLAVHVQPSTGRSAGEPGSLERQRLLVEQFGGSYHLVLGDDVAAALLEFTRGAGATTLVLGSGRRRLRRLGRTTSAVLRRAGDLDVAVVPDPHLSSRPPWRRSAIVVGRRRWYAGLGLAAIGLPMLTFGLSHLRGSLSLPSHLLIFLFAVVGIALVGGLGPAVLAAVLASLLVNWYFTPPYYTLTIEQPQNLLALLVFLVVALAVSILVNVAGRQATEAARAGAEAETLSTLAGSVLRGEDALPALLGRIRETFGVPYVALQERSGTGDWSLVSWTGDPGARNPRTRSTLPVAEDLRLVLSGAVLPAGHRRVLVAFAAQAAAELERRRLAQQASEAERLAQGNRMRTALLAAVSHDLRTPLASIKAAASSLRQQDVAWSAEDEAELLATIEESADTLDNLVGNLLDMSRLQTRTIEPLLRPVSLDEVVPAALAGLDGAATVRLDVPEDLPLVLADPGLLERVVANLAANALRYSPAGAPPLIRAAASPGAVHVDVVDHGPGVPGTDHERIFEPFQRLGDRGRGSGVGLGLAVARGFAEVMGGCVEPRDTPGGGLTMRVVLKAATP